MALTKITSNMASLDTLTANNGVLELDDNGTHNGIINVPASLSINIDSDNGATTETFSIAKDKTGINDTDVLFRVQEDGKVMVGSTSPDSLFHIESASSTAMTIQAGTDSSASIRLKNDAVDWDINCQTNDNFAIYSHTSAKERLVITTDGEMKLLNGLSVQSNYTGLGQCVGAYGQNIAAFAVSRNSSGSALYVSKQNTGTSDMVAFHVAGNDVGEITTNGSNSTTFTGTSDYRLKENVEPLPNATARLNALNPVAFDWIRDGQEDEGFLAHEVQEQVPYAATGVKDELYTEENTPPEMIEKLGQPKYQKVDYGRLTPLLVKALQEANAEIEALKTRIETLENA